MNLSSVNRTEVYRVYILLVIIIAFLILTYLHNIAKMLIVERNFADFANYYFFSKQLREGQNIYELTNTELTQLYQKSHIPTHIAGKAEYSPIFFFMMIPFSHLSFWSANLVWLLLNHIALIACMWFSALIINPRTQHHFLSLSFLVVIFFASQPLLENIGIGQINILILLPLTVICYLQQHHKQHLLAGVFLGFILLLKPQFGLLLLFFLIKRNYSFCISAFISFIVLRVIGVITCGLSIEVSYWKNLLNNIYYISSGINVFNLSLKEVFNRLFFEIRPQSYAILFYVVTSLTLCFFTFLRILRDEDRNFLAEYSSLICLILIVSPLTEEHHLILANLPIAIAICNLKAERSNVVLLMLSFLLIAVRYSFASFSIFDTGIPSALTFGKTAGVFLLWYIFIRDMYNANNTKDIIS